jgi:hypothetical protein
MKNLDFKNLPATFLPFLQKVRRYVALIFIVGIAAMYGFLVFRINSLATSEPTEDAVMEELQTVQRPRIDQDALNKIQQLQDSNVEVQALFKHARDNPFQE